MSSFTPTDQLAGPADQLEILRSFVESRPIPSWATDNGPDVEPDPDPWSPSDLEHFAELAADSYERHLERNHP